MRDVFIHLSNNGKIDQNLLLFASRLTNKQVQDDDKLSNSVRLGLFISSSFKNFQKCDIDDFFNRLDELQKCNIEYCFSISNHKNFYYLSTIVEVLAMQKDISVSYQGKLTPTTEDKIINEITNEKIKLRFSSILAKGHIARFLIKNYPQ